MPVCTIPSVIDCILTMPCALLSTMPCVSLLVRLLPALRSSQCCCLQPFDCTQCHAHTIRAFHPHFNEQWVVPRSGCTTAVLLLWMLVLLRHSNVTAFCARVFLVDCWCMVRCRLIVHSFTCRSFVPSYCPVCMTYNGSAIVGGALTAGVRFSAH